MPGAYTAGPTVAARPEYMQVNVYWSRDGWYVSYGMRRAGGPFPRCTERPTSVRLPSDAPNRAGALAAAARVLKQAAEDLGSFD